MESVWSVSKLSTESVGSLRELDANCVHTADADAIKQFRRVGGVYWALEWLWQTRLYLELEMWKGPKGDVHFQKCLNITINI